LGNAVIRNEDCTDSNGNKGQWVLYNSEGTKQLGCHTSRESALSQERAIKANKSAKEKILNRIKEVKETL
jgi:hypothetical protein